MVHGLSIAGDVFWIVALALMASLTLAAWRRLPADAVVPVLWSKGRVNLRLPRAVALLALPVVAFLIGMWLKFESRSPDMTPTGAWIGLGVRVTLAPLLGLLHVGWLQRALAIMDAEGDLPPPPAK